MKSLLFALLFLICILCDFYTYSQVSLYPAHLGQVPFAKGIYNPSLQYTSGLIDIVSTNQFYSTQFSQIRNVFLMGSFGIQKHDTSNVKQRVGFKFVSEIEGAYLSRSKFYISYLWSTRLSRTLRLSAAANVGRANYTYQATLVTSTSSSNNWDGDIGISLSGTNFTLGFAVNQFFDSKITPLFLEYRWKRFMTGYLEKQFRLSPGSRLLLFLHGSFLTNVFNRYDAGFQLIFPKKILLGANYYINNAVTFNFGLDQIHLQKHNLSLLFSYTYPFSNQIKLNVQNYELGLHYFLQKRN